jgi:hypothetical protein
MTEKNTHNTILNFKTLVSFNFCAKYELFQFICENFNMNLEKEHLFKITN